MKFIIFSFLVLQTLLLANQPHKLNFQGILTDNLGAPAADSTYTFGFSIYDAEVAGNKLWEETKVLNTANGVYQTTLGNDSSLTILPFDKTYYVQITVNNTVLPLRSKLIPVPYAISANTVTGTIAATTQIADGLVVKGLNGLTDHVNIQVAGQLTITTDPASNAIIVTDTGSVIGPQGPAGPTGTPGAAGTNGTPGTTGPKGDQGDIGHGLAIERICNSSTRDLIMSDSKYYMQVGQMCLDTLDFELHMFHVSGQQPQFLRIGQATAHPDTISKWNVGWEHVQSNNDSLHFTSVEKKTIAEQPVSISLDGYLTSTDYTSFLNASTSIPTLFNQDTLFRTTTLDSISNVSSRLTSSITTLQSSSWQLNGTDSLYTSKKVGIGTNSPLANLHIKGEHSPLILERKDTFEDQNNSWRFQISHGNLTGISDGSLIINALDSAADFVIKTNDAADQTNFIVTATGLVGIGNNSPSEKLDVSGAIKFSGKTTTPCTAANAGTMVYANNVFSGCIESDWINFVPQDTLLSLTNRFDSLALVVKNMEISPISYSSCKNILDRQPGSPSGIYTIDPDGLGTLQPMNAYCDMTTDSGGWTMWYTTDQYYHLIDGEVSNIDYGSNGYSIDLRTVPFTDVLYVRESDSEKDWFKKDDNSHITVSSYISSNELNANPNTVWSGYGGADTSYKYQLTIADKTWMQIGLMITGYLDDCYKLANSWCNDSTSNYYRINGEGNGVNNTDQFSGVSFRENGHNNLSNNLISVGIR